MPRPAHERILDNDPLTDTRTPIGAFWLWQVTTIVLLIWLDGWWRLFALIPTTLAASAIASLPARIWHRGFHGGYR